MVLNIFIDVSVQPERFELLLNTSKEYNILEKYDINIVDNLKECDLIIFLVSSQINLVNLEDNHKYIFETEKPIIILERQDSSITWVRDIDKIKNLKAIFKNRKLKSKELQNSNQTYYGKYQYYLIHKNFKLNRLITENGTDIGISHYQKDTKLKEIKNLGKVMCILWDFHSSPLCQKLSMNYFRNNEINFRKTIDVFCVNQVKTNNFVNIPRIKAKKIVDSLSNKYKVITNNMKPDEYENIFSKCRIAVACWGFGEWVHMDGYALYAGAILIKPNTSHVRMYPDIYKEYETYIPCKHDYSDLKEIIIDVLKNYNKYIPKLIKNRERLMKINEKDTSDLFWKKVKELS